MKITANMATMPKRLKTAIKTIESIYDQVSLVRLYLNNFDIIPKEFIDDKIYVYQGRDLKSSGKVFWADTPNEYYFCIDDDILYPSDYVDYTLKKLHTYDDDVIVSYHGRVFPRNRKVNDYFKDRTKFIHFTQKNPQDEMVDVIGNGVSCWNTNNIKIDVNKFQYHYMDDILVSAQAHEQGKRRIVVSHEEGYLKILETSSGSLYEKYNKNSTIQTKVCNSIEW